MYGREFYDIDNNLSRREKNWNQRFILEKIPKFDAYNDVNYLSLGLLKSKIRYEERIKREEANSKYAGRIYSAHYVKPRSLGKYPKENLNYQKSLRSNKPRDRTLSIKVSQDPNVNFNMYKNKNNFTMSNAYNPGRNTNRNVGGSQRINFIHEYKSPNMNQNIKNPLIEEDSEISEEYELLKELWEKLGVTESYVSNFEFILNSKNNNRDSILQMITGEKKQMKKFRLELMKVISEANKRENKINDLKQFISAYEQVRGLNKIKEEDKNKENKGENNSDNKSESKDDKRKKNIGEVNKQLIENDIHDCLKSLRLRTINAINIFKKFKSTYYHLFNNKISLDFIKNKYGFDDKYLSKVKNDLDFLKDSAINDLYHFSEKGGDPFLLCISDKCGNKEDLKKYKQLSISNELLSVVKSYLFSIEQEEVFTMISDVNTQKQSQNYMMSMSGQFNNLGNNNMNINNYNSYNNYNTYHKTSNILNNTANNNDLNDRKLNISKNYKNAVNENLLSGNFKGNVDYEKMKLKAQNEYKNMFFNTEETYDDLQKNIEMKKSPKEEKKYELPGMTSKQLYQHLSKYGKFQRELFPPYNKELIQEQVQKSMIQKIEDRMNKVETEFKEKMNEKMRKEEEKIKEEELRIKTEKEKIEKMRIEEEEERKKKEEKYLKYEKERLKRKKNDKKRKEENERYTKRENDLFVMQMQMKFLKEVDDRFKRENQRQLDLQKEIMNEKEEKDKERQDEIEKIRTEEFEKIKRRDVVVDLRSEEEKKNVAIDPNIVKNMGDDKDNEKEGGKKKDDDNKYSEESKSKKTKSKKSRSRKTKSKKKSGSSEEENEEEDEDEDEDEDDSDKKDESESD